MNFVCIRGTHRISVYFYIHRILSIYSVLEEFFFVWIYNCICISQSFWSFVSRLPNIHQCYCWVESVENTDWEGEMAGDGPGTQAKHFNLLSLVVNTSDHNSFHHISCKVGNYQKCDHIPALHLLLILRGIRTSS